MSTHLPLTVVRRLVHQVLQRTTTAVDIVPGDRHTLDAILHEAAYAAARNLHPHRPAAQQRTLADWLHAEAALQLITAAGWPCSGTTDPRLTAGLDRINTLGHTVQLNILRRATNVLNPTARPSSRRRHTSAPRITLNPRSPAGSCGCDCTEDEGCDCGHAGCGGR
ncbi:hypothetical protein [Streptomyces boninensis]|uniref:hypothetical protein n=1 Tax=Streptomyces boninensis TaxID=2039455 RepID=UPI003B213640